MQYNKRSMIRVFLLIRNDTTNCPTKLLSQFGASGYSSRNSLQYCKVSSLTSQFTPDIVAIYTDSLIVPCHAQHCDGQWLIIDNYYRVSFKLLCHVVHMRLPMSRHHIANDTWLDAPYRIAAPPPSPDAHCVIALWRRMEFLIKRFALHSDVAYSYALTSRFHQETPSHKTYTCQ